jgi:hypothetical protein
MRGSKTIRCGAAAAVAAAALAMSGPSGAEPTRTERAQTEQTQTEQTQTTPTQPQPAAPEPPQTLALRYSFEQVATTTAVDESGRAHALTTLVFRGGTVRTVAHDTGRALEFPAACRGAKCPRVVLQTSSADDLNPGAGPFRYGATVLLPRNRTTAGQNVLQKGYSATGGQYKLQIDGSAGQPSCVLADAGRPRIHIARSMVSVADGAWHRIECRRSGSSLTVLVDGVERGRATIPAALTVANQAPLRIGGKGAYTDNDQFHGTIDDVWLTRG